MSSFTLTETKVLEAQREQAEADAAFRGSVTALCVADGMDPKAHAVLHVANALTGRGADRKLINELAKVAVDYDIPEGMPIEVFFADRCDRAEELEERLGETEHRLAELESGADVRKALEEIKTVVSASGSALCSYVKHSEGLIDGKLSTLQHSVGNVQSWLSHIRNEAVTRTEVAIVTLLTIASSALSTWIIAG